MAKSSAEPPGRSGSQFFVVARGRRRPAARIRAGRQGQRGLRRGRTDRQARHPGRKTETDRPDRKDLDRKGLARRGARHRSESPRMAKVDVGDAAPDFELPGTGGKTYKLSDYRGKNVVLAFYPGDDTTRLHGAVLLLPRQRRAHRPARRRGAGHLAAVGRLARALGAGAEPQRAAARRRGPGRQQELWRDRLARSAGELTELKDAPGGRYVMRAIFVIDGEGIVRYRHVSRTGSDLPVGRRSRAGRRRPSA